MKNIFYKPKEREKTYSTFYIFFSHNSAYILNDSLHFFFLYIFLVNDKKKCKESFKIYAELYNFKRVIIDLSYI